MRTRREPVDVVLDILREHGVWRVLNTDGCECGEAEICGVHIQTHCQRTTCRNCDDANHYGKCVHVAVYHMDGISVADASKITAEVMSQMVCEINDDSGHEWFLEWWRAAFADRDGSGMAGVTSEW